VPNILVGRNVLENIQLMFLGLHSLKDRSSSGHLANGTPLWVNSPKGRSLFARNHTEKKPAKMPSTHGHWYKDGLGRKLSNANNQN
jgi:hypothetical protein